MKNILCIGNGPSRKGINFKVFCEQQNIDYTMGCNKIYKDYIPDMITFWDDTAVYDLVTQDVNFFRTNFYRRVHILNDHSRNLSRAYLSNSGIYNILFAIQKFGKDKIQSINIIGYDSVFDDNKSGANCYTYSIARWHEYDKTQSYYSLNNDFDSVLNNIYRIAEENENIKFIIHSNGRKKLKSSYREKPKNIILKNKTILGKTRNN